MFQVKPIHPDEMRVRYAEVKRDILKRIPDAEHILRYLAAKDVAVFFVQPNGVSGAFNDKADAGSLSVMDNRIFLDARKPLEQQADDLARRARAMIAAPAPNALERFLHERMGISYGRIMKLEKRDGFSPSA